MCSHASSASLSLPVCFAVFKILINAQYVMAFGFGVFLPFEVFIFFGLALFCLVFLVILVSNLVILFRIY